jgi:hypothetical protein
VRFYVTGQGFKRRKTGIFFWKEQIVFNVGLLQRMMRQEQHPSSSGRFKTKMKRKKVTSWETNHPDELDVRKRWQEEKK